MPAGPPPRRTQSPILWILLLLGVPLLFLCCGGLSVVTYFVVTRAADSTGSGILPSVTREQLDPNNLENTRAWAASTVRRLKEVESKGDAAATKREIGKVEQQLKDAFLNKKVRWKFAVLDVRKDGSEVNVETFFGPDGGPFRGDDPRFAGKPTRKLYFRVYFDTESDGVLIGRDVSREQANRLHKGDPVEVKEKVIEVMLRHHDQWLMPNKWTDGVDVLDDFCITLILKHSP